MSSRLWKIFLYIIGTNIYGTINRKVHIFCLEVLKNKVTYIKCKAINHHTCPFFNNISTDRIRMKISFDLQKYIKESFLWLRLHKHCCHKNLLWKFILATCYLFLCLRSQYICKLLFNSNLINSNFGLGYIPAFLEFKFNWPNLWFLAITLVKMTKLPLLTLYRPILKCKVCVKYFGCLDLIIINNYKSLFFL